jgi:hypothetical protein
MARNKRVVELFAHLFLVPMSAVTLRCADVSSLIQIGFSVVWSKTYFTRNRNNVIIIQAIGRFLHFITLTQEISWFPPPTFLQSVQKTWLNAVLPIHLNLKHIYTYLIQNWWLSFGSHRPLGLILVKTSFHVIKTFVLNKTACFELNKMKVYNPEIVSLNLLTQSISSYTKNSKHRCAQTYRCAIICTCLRYLLLSIASNNLGWSSWGFRGCFNPLQNTNS